MQKELQMKYKMSKTRWQEIGKETGWLAKKAYAINEDVKMCERCGTKAACEVTDEEGSVMGYTDYCEECDARMDMGPMCKLLKDLGPQEAKALLEELTNDSKQDFGGKSKFDFNLEDENELPF